MSNQNLTRVAILITTLALGLTFFANQVAPATASYGMPQGNTQQSYTSTQDCSALQSYFQTHNASSNKMLYLYYQSCLSQLQYSSNNPSCSSNYYQSCYSTSNYLTKSPSCYYVKYSYGFYYKQYAVCYYVNGSYYNMPCYYSCASMYGYSYSNYPYCYYSCYGYQYPGSQYGYTYDSTPSAYGVAVTTDPANVAPVSGSGNYTKGNSASFAVTQSTINVSPNERYVFSHWIGDYSGNQTSGSITVDAAKKVTAVYQLQYRLDVNAQPTSAPAPQGSGWYNAGDSVALTPPNQMLGGEDGTRLVFSGWNVDGSSVQTDAPLQLKMNSAHTVNSVYKTQYYLNVLADEGAVSGEGWYDAGTNANIYVSNPPSPSFGVQPVFNGWTGDLNSNTQSATVVMSKPETVIASWHNDYTLLYLTVGAVAAVLMGGIGTVAYAFTRRRSDQTATTQLPSQRNTPHPASAMQSTFAGPETEEQNGGTAGLSGEPTSRWLHSTPSQRSQNASVRCVSCGGEVAGPAKEWDMHPKDGRGPAVHIKHYSCPQCGKKFRLATKVAGA